MTPPVFADMLWCVWWEFTKLPWGFHGVWCWFPGEAIWNPRKAGPFASKVDKFDTPIKTNLEIKWTHQKRVYYCNTKFIYIYIWLVVLTILKNISQWEGLSHILWKIKNVWNHQPDMHLVHYPNHIHPIIFIHIPIVPSYSHHFPSCPWNIYQCSIFV